MGSTSWPAARPTMMHSAPRCTPTADTLGSIRTSAEPRPVRPASGLAMQLMASLDQRSPKRLVVTCVSATAFITWASSFARSVTRPSCSPILKPMVPVSVRMAWPGSYMPAPIVMTEPRVHDALRREVLQGHRRRPLRVVRLDRDEHRVERLRDRLQLVDVQGLDGNPVLAARAAQAEPDTLHLLHVLWPLVDERDVAARPREHPTHHTPDGACADDGDSLNHVGS